MDGTNKYVAKVMKGWEQHDQDVAETQQALDDGETPEFATDDYVRLLKERGQISDE